MHKTGMFSAESQQCCALTNDTVEKLTSHNAVSKVHGGHPTVRAMRVHGVFLTKWHLVSEYKGVFRFSVHFVCFL